MRDIAIALLHGTRFDLAAITLLNAPLWLLILMSRLAINLPATIPRSLRRPLPGAFVVLVLLLNVPFLLLAVGDAEYFKLSGKRSSADIFAIRSDLGNQAGQLARQHWMLLVIGGLLIAASFAIARTAQRALRGQASRDQSHPRGAWMESPRART